MGKKLAALILAFFAFFVGLFFRQRNKQIQPELDKIDQKKAEQIRQTREDTEARRAQEPTPKQVQATLRRIRERKR